MENKQKQNLGNSALKMKNVGELKQKRNQLSLKNKHMNEIRIAKLAMKKDKKPRNGVTSNLNQSRKRERTGQNWKQC